MQCGNVLGMRVVNDQQITGVNFIHRKQIPNRLLERTQTFVMIQVANMLADKCLAVHDKRDGVLEIRANSEDWAPGWKLRRDGTGSVSSSTSQHRRSEHTGASNGIIHATRDRPLANQKTIRDARKFPCRVFVLIRDWLAGTVRAG